MSRNIFQYLTSVFTPRKSGPYKFAFKTIEAAEELIKGSQNNVGNIRPAQYVALLSMLERNIDFARTLAKPGSSLYYSEHKKEVEIRMNKIRAEIANIAKLVNKGDLEQTLKSYGNEIGGNFLFNSESQKNTSS